MENKFDFLSSTRFWSIVVGAVSLYLSSKGYFGDAEMVLIATITAGFTVVRTIDRIGEKRVEAEVEAKSPLTSSFRKVPVDFID